MNASTIIPANALNKYEYIYTKVSLEKNVRCLAKTLTENKEHLYFWTIKIEFLYHTNSTAFTVPFIKYFFVWGFWQSFHFDVEFLDVYFIQGFKYTSIFPSPLVLALKRVTANVIEKLKGSNN